MPSLLRSPSPSMVVACLSLGIALSGVGYAAVALDANSVGSREVKRNSLRGVDVRESTFGKVPNANKLDGKDSTAFAPKRQTVIKVASCTGSTFVPNDTSAGTFVVSNHVKYLQDTAITAMTCHIELPNGARVIQLIADYVDGHTTGRVSQVRLDRVKLSGTNVGLVESLAAISPTATNSLTPGNVSESDDVIAFDVVNLAQYGYAITAAFNTTGSQALALGVRGVRVVMYLDDVLTATPPAP